MNELMRKQIYEDYREVLSSDAGLRVFGGIFVRAGLMNAGLLSDYQQGMRALGQQIANTIREIDAHLVGECEIAYRELMRGYEDERRDDSD